MATVTFNERGLKNLLHDDYELISVKIINNNREILIEYNERDKEKVRVNK